MTAKKTIIISSNQNFQVPSDWDNNQNSITIIGGGGGGGGYQNAILSQCNCNCTTINCGNCTKGACNCSSQCNCNCTQIQCSTAPTAGANGASGGMLVVNNAFFSVGQLLSANVGGPGSGGAGGTSPAAGSAGSNSSLGASYSANGGVGGAKG